MRVVVIAAALLPFATDAVATDVRVEMSRINYDLFEPVEVTITNHGDVPVFMPVDPPLRIERAGEHVAPCGWWLQVVFFDPGESRSYTIHQMDCETGLPAAWSPGPYLTRVPYKIFEPPYPEYEATAAFCVEIGCVPTSSPEPDVAPSPWGAVKDRYRVGGGP